MANREKHPGIVLSAMTAVGLICLLLVVPWMRRISFHDPVFSALALVNAVIWWLILWWSVHHLAFRLAGLWARPAVRKSTEKVPPIPFVLLYPTCDDFQPQACDSALTQEYDGELLKIVICDDSRSDEHRTNVDEFAAARPQATLVRRASRTGFKAGNLNHAIERLHSDAEWLLLVDADQRLPRDYVAQFACAVAELPDDVAFVQARHSSDHMLPTASTPFQRVLGSEIDVFYSCDMAHRERFGLVPLMGHGAALRRSAWKKVGGFPEVVSEDFAMTVKLRNAGFVGIYASGISSWESFPESFGAFLIRFRKFAAGTGELIRRFVGRFLVGPSTFTEKLDFSMLVLWYLLMPLIFLNGFLSAYVCHRLWSLRIAALHPVLPVAFVALFVVQLPPVYASTSNVFQAIQHWFWSIAIYGACLPPAAVRFVRYLFGGTPPFDRTPKDGEAVRTSWRIQGSMLLAAILSIACGFYWHSPFSPVLWGLGVSYLLVPTYEWLNERSWRGLAIQFAVFVPGGFYIWALVEMWTWGVF